jgi:glycolate oxidase FAD binding subunit
VTGTASSAADVRLVATESEAVDAVRSAYAERTSLRITAGRHWLVAGRPVAADAFLDVSLLSGIVEYVPEDLTMTVRAGTTLAEVDEATRAHGQWLPLDPFGATHGTLGATLATASAGPLGSALGAPRDVTLGLAFITGDGRLVRGGGRVVKNVAGFDLVRLTVGAWGTTGAIVEATVRLRARPEVDETVAIALPDHSSALSSLLAKLRVAAAMPIATELVTPALARRIGLAEDAQLLVRLAGNADSVRAQLTEVQRLSPIHPTSADVWDRLRHAEPPICSVVRLSGRPSELAHRWNAARTLIAHFGGEAHASLERGTVRCWLIGDESAILAELEGLDPIPRLYERLPLALWPRLAPVAGEDRLSRAIRAAFDPARILNPGILGEVVT